MNENGIFSTTGSMRWAGYVAYMKEMSNTYKMLIEISEGKRSGGRPRRRSEDNIKMDLKEIHCEVVGWIQPTQDRVRWLAVVNTAVNFPVP
jgi:hypothetical protein